MASVLELVSQALLLLQGTKTPDPNVGNVTTENQLDRLVHPASSYELEGDIQPNIDSALRGLEWTKDEKLNLEMFEAGFQHSQFHSLADLIDSVAPACNASSLTDGRANVSSIDVMLWSNDKELKGFTHEGPCEAWIDNYRVYNSISCRASNQGWLANGPIDFSVCKGNCMFKFYWLSTNSAPKWRAFKHCAAITTLEAKSNPNMGKLDLPHHHKMQVPIKSIRQSLVIEANYASVDNSSRKTSRTSDNKTVVRESDRIENASDSTDSESGDINNSYTIDTAKGKLRTTHTYDFGRGVEELTANCNHVRANMRFEKDSNAESSIQESSANTFQSQTTLHDATPASSRPTQRASANSQLFQGPADSPVIEAIDYRKPHEPRFAEQRAGGVFGLPTNQLRTITPPFHVDVPTHIQLVVQEGDTNTIGNWFSNGERTQSSDKIFQHGIDPRDVNREKSRLSDPPTA